MVDQYFGNDSLEPFESKYIGSTGLAMAYLWLSWPSLMRGYQDIYQYYDKRWPFLMRGYKDIFSPYGGTHDEAPKRGDVAPLAL